MLATIVNQKVSGKIGNPVQLSDNIRTANDLIRELGLEAGSKIYEGRTHTDLVDSTPIPPLPAEQAGSGYFFIVSAPQNKIKNGVFSRQECYAKIKEMNLQDAVKQAYGRNFTQVNTADLNQIINDNHGAPVHGTATAASTAPAAHVYYPVTEKDLVNGILDVLENLVFGAPTVPNLASKVAELKDSVNKVFPNPFSVQDVNNMMK